MNIVQLKKMQYDEVAKCTRCGFCLPNCPTYAVKRSERYTARGRNAITRALIEGRLEPSEVMANSVFTCLGCGACTAACFPAVKTKGAVMDDRALMVEEGLQPATMHKLVESLNEYHNITEDDNEERGDWKELLKDVPEEYLDKDTAEVAYFVGCVASFFPLAQKIPAGFAEIMYKAGLDFTVLGGEEWCCGFPLIGAGEPGKLEEMKAHNLEKVRATGAKTVVFACPSCYHTWKHFYNAEGIELMHASQLMAKLVKDGKLDLKPVNLKVTYHDPCDLGRNSGVYDEPRQVIAAIPGVEFVDLPNNRNLSVCCGGGGNVEMVDPELSQAIAQMKIEEIQSTGAQAVVSACQQCLRTIATRARRAGVDLTVMDLTQLVKQSLA
jgi:heterodisulfide reductase subunit D